MLTSNAHVRYHVCMHVVPHWVSTLLCVARFIKSTLCLNHRQEQNSSGLSHEKCTGEAVLSLEPCAGVVCVLLQSFDVVH